MKVLVIGLSPMGSPRSPRGWAETSNLFLPAGGGCRALPLAGTRGRLWGRRVWRAWSLLPWTPPLLHSSRWQPHLTFFSASQTCTISPTQSLCQPGRPSQRGADPLKHGRWGVSSLTYCPLHGSHHQPGGCRFLELCLCLVLVLCPVWTPPALCRGNCQGGALPASRLDPH